MKQAREVLEFAVDGIEEQNMTLELYMRDTCPYCRRVIEYINSAGRTDIVYKDINKSEEAAETLVNVGGKRQVPCLFIDGKPLYESLDIIKWLEEHPEC